MTDDAAVRAASGPASTSSEVATHLLRQLRLPSRYESLVAAVGADVARLLVEPSDETLTLFRKAALAIRSRGRGLFLPVFAESGTGKTTLVSNLSGWITDEFGPTARLAGGEVTADRLRQAVAALVQEHQIAENDKRILVINVDDRESDPPSDKELSQIKSFLREAAEQGKWIEPARTLGSRTLVVWPETSRDIANTMSLAYQERAGKSPVAIPADINGPGRDTWPGVASATLRLVNSIDRLAELGVDPANYDPLEYPTLCDYLDAISADFLQLLHDLLTSQQLPLRVLVVFATESGKTGILSALSSGQYGMLDADKLLSATPASAIGKWWVARSGLLVQTIVKLDARVGFMPPALSIPIVNRYGPEAATDLLRRLGVNPRSPSEIGQSFERSALGKSLRGTAQPTTEGRGNPAADTAAAFSLLASDYGFNSGHDKRLNRAVGDFLTQHDPGLGEVVVERKAPGVPLIPDLTLIQEGQAVCLEFHWRSGEYLVPGNLSAMAQYVLTKLKAYAVELGWVANS